MKTSISYRRLFALRTQAGLSLIELLIAMTLGLMLMSVVGTIMINSKRAYNIQTDMAYLQENARFAMSFLSNDLRMSGFFGCTGVAPAGMTALIGTNNNGITNSGMNNNGSDVLQLGLIDSNRNAFSVVHCPDSEGCPQKPNPLQDTPLKQGLSSIPMTNRGDIVATDTVIASDCGGSDVYTVSKVEGGNVLLTSPLVRDYRNNGESYGAQLRRLRVHRYFIARKSDGNGDYDYSLYRDQKVLTAGFDPNSAEEMIEGVENLQLRYGIDGNANGVPEKYVTATAVTDWNKVVSVQISLLMRTLIQRNDRDPDTHTFQLDPDDPQYGPIEDYRRRVLFTNTVFLRNNSLN